MSVHAKVSPVNPAQSDSRNSLLRRMSAGDFSLLQSHSQLVDLPFRTVIVQAYEPIPYVYFLTEGLGSVIAVNIDDQVEVAHIGYEGVSGTALAYGDTMSSNTTMMQVGGAGWQVPASVFAEAFGASASFRGLMLAYANA